MEQAVRTHNVIRYTNRLAREDKYIDSW